MTNTEPRYYATKDDAGVPTVYDWENVSHPVATMLGGTMWEARRLAAHLNGEHSERRNPRCEECQAGR